MINTLSAFKNDAGFADMFDEMLLINQSKVSYFRSISGQLPVRNLSIIKPKVPLFHITLI